MEGHQRNLYLYDRFQRPRRGRQPGRCDHIEILGKDLGVTFPLLSNITGFLGVTFDTLIEGKPIFRRRTVIIDKTGIIRYARDGSPDFKDILLFLKKLNQEGGKP